MEATLVAPPAPLVRLDIGCGTSKKPGFIGVDALSFPGVDVVTDLRPQRDANGKAKPWPWEDDSVDEIHCSHFIEHLTNLDERYERVHFFNEVWRILKVGGKCMLILPHWSSARYYGDPTHKEAMSEWAFLYLNPTWRLANAPHTDASNDPRMYRCNFDSAGGYGMHRDLAARSGEFQQFAMQWYKEACQDSISTLTKVAL